MKMPPTSRLLAATVCLALLLASGCYTRKPVGIGYKNTEQHSMQSAYHWEVLAADVAAQIVKAVKDRDDIVYRPLYVVPPNETPFARGFHELLTSELVKRGQLVSVEEEDSLTVHYRVMGVEHDEEGQNPIKSLPPGTGTALPLGILVLRNMPGADAFLLAASAMGSVFDMANGYYQGFPATEIIITTDLTYNNKYVVHTSDIYYIEEPEMAQYTEPFKSQAFTPRTMKIVAQ
ncbi:MAG: hypothetical protein AB7E47_01905 [Desulfovibrionaceae bacterium]